MSSPAGNDATDIVAIEVDGDDSPLSSASQEVVRLPLWDDLGRSYNLNCNLLHKFIPSFGLKGDWAYHSTRSRSWRWRLTAVTRRWAKSLKCASRPLLVTTIIWRRCDRCQQWWHNATLSHDHSLLAASSCVKLTSVRTQCSLRAASYMYAVHIAVDQHALLVAWTQTSLLQVRKVRQVINCIVLNSNATSWC